MCIVGLKQQLPVRKRECGGESSVLEVLLKSVYKAGYAKPTKGF